MGDPGGRIYLLQEQGYFGQVLRHAQRTGEITVNSLLTHTPRFMLQGMGFEDVWGTWEIGSVGPNQCELHRYDVV